MAKQTLNRAFLPFTTLHTRTSRPIQATVLLYTNLALSRGENAQPTFHKIKGSNRI